MAEGLTKEDKQWVVVAVLFGLIIVVAFYMLWWKPETQRLAGMEQQKATLQANVDKDIAYLAEAQTRTEELKAHVAQFEQQLPNEKEIPELLTFLKNAANEAEIEYVSIIAQPLAPAEFYIEVPFNIILKAKFHNIGQVVNKIENYTRLMKVDNVDLSAGKEKPFKHTIAFKLSTYVFNPNPAPKVSKPAGK